MSHNAFHPCQARNSHSLTPLSLPHIPYETVYLIPSLRPQQCRRELLIDLTRGCWGARENGCRRVRDNQCAKDKCWARKGNLPRSLALFANLALSMLRMVGTRNIAEAMELNCYQPNQAVALATP